MEIYKSHLKTTLYSNNYSVFLKQRPARTPGFPRSPEGRLDTPAPGLVRETRQTAFERLCGKSWTRALVGSDYKGPGGVGAIFAPRNTETTEMIKKKLKRSSIAM